MSKRASTGVPPHPKPYTGRKKEFVIFSGYVREQIGPPFFEVHVKGHSVEFTDKRSEAHSAFTMGGKPKTLTAVWYGGRRELLEEA